MTNQPEKRLTETELRICLKYPASELEHEWLACHIAALESDLARVTQERDEARATIKNRCDACYVEMINRSKQPVCLGWEAKAREGKFGQAEYDAHAVNHRLYGEHVAYAEALKLLSAPAPEPHERNRDES